MVLYRIKQAGRLLQLRSLFLTKNVHTATTESGLPNLAKLTDRALLRIKGRDAAKLLQGITTNDINLLVEGTDKIQYTMFLNSQGRVEYDAFLYVVPGETAEYLIECDAAVSDDVMSHIKKYKLRSKVEISDASKEMETWALFSRSGKLDGSMVEKTGIIAEKDTRTNALGIRMVIPWNQSPVDLLGIKDCLKVDSVVYKEHRYTLGIAEGIQEIPPGNPLPLEYNLALINGGMLHSQIRL